MKFLESCLEIATGVSGVLHVGAHDGKEAEAYARHGISLVTWIEANPDLEQRLRSRVEPLGHRVFIEAIGDRFSPATPFYVASNDGESSSLLRMAAHKDVWPEVTETETKTVAVDTIDSLHRRYGLHNHNFWVLDMQGMEADALAGAHDTLTLADYVLCEFTGDLYEGGATLDRIDRLLADFSAVSGWRRTGSNFGEVFYQRVRRSGSELLRLL